MRLIRVTLLICLGLSFGSLAEEAENLESLTREWLALRREIQRNEAAWQEENQLLQDETQLLTRRHEQLQAEEAAAQAKLKTEQTANAAAGTEAAKVDAHLQEVTDALSRSGAALEALLGGLPDEMRAEINLNSHETLPGQIEGLQQSYEALARLASNLREGSVILQTPDGTKRQMAVLYIGIQVAFAVGEDGGSAACGVCQDGKWIWRFGEVDPLVIKHVLAIYRGDEPADYVAVPLQIREPAP